LSCNLIILIDYIVKRFLEDINFVYTTNKESINSIINKIIDVYLFY